MRKIISVVGARPNFMKMAPIHKAFQSYGNKVQHLICHTGQHYDKTMSKIFFKDLELPKPNFYLGVGSGSHAVQTAKVMVEFERIIFSERPHLVIVYGDINSTAACTMVAAKLGVKVVHVEAGLRSFDRAMPEEINRIITDHLSDYLFVTEKSAVLNLKNEGIPEDRIFFVGNVMIDSIVQYLPRTDLSKVLKKYNLQPHHYILVTLHRPSNVDDTKNIRQIFKVLNKLAEKRRILFPIHPRTKSVLQMLKLNFDRNLLVVDPVGYIDFLALMKNAELVITDSGGIQEETTYLDVQCLTLRDNTERPVTVEEGTNKLIGTNLKVVEKEALETLNGKIKKGTVPFLWDGKASLRIIKTILSNRILDK